MLRKIMLILALLLLSSCANPYGDREEVKYEPSEITLDVSKENLELIKDYLQHNKVIEKWITDNYVSQRYIRLEKSEQLDDVFTFKAFENRDFLTFDYSNDYLLIKEDYFIYKKFSFIDENKTAHDMRMYIQNQDAMGNYIILLDSSYDTPDRTIRSTNEYSFNPNTQTFTNPYFHNEITIDEKLKHTLVLQLETGIKEYEEFASNLMQVKAELVSMFTHDTQEYIDYSYEYLSTHYYKKMQVVDNQGNTKDFTFQNYEELVELLKNGKQLCLSNENKLENPNFTIQLNPETLMEVYPFAVQIYDKTNYNTYSFEDSTLYDYMNSLYNYELLNEVAKEEIVKPIPDKKLFDLLNQTIEDNKVFESNDYILSLNPFSIKLQYSDGQIQTYFDCYNNTHNELSCSYFTSINYDFNFTLENGEKHEAFYNISPSYSDKNIYSIEFNDYDFTSYFSYENGKLENLYFPLPEEVYQQLLNQLPKDVEHFEKQLSQNDKVLDIITNIINNNKSECLYATDKCEPISNGDITYLEWEDLYSTKYPEDIKGYMNTISLFTDSLESDLIQIDDSLIQNLSFKVPRYYNFSEDKTKYTSDEADDTLYIDEKYYDFYCSILKASDIDKIAKTILPNSEPIAHHDIGILGRYNHLKFINELNLYQQFIPDGDSAPTRIKIFYFEKYEIKEDGIHVSVRLINKAGYDFKTFVKDKNGQTYHVTFFKNHPKNINTFIANNLDLFNEYEFILEDYPNSEYYTVKDIKKLN